MPIDFDLEASMPPDEQFGASHRYVPLPLFIVPFEGQFIVYRGHERRFVNTFSAGDLTAYLVRNFEAELAHNREAMARETRRGSLDDIDLNLLSGFSL